MPLEDSLKYSEDHPWIDLIKSIFMPFFVECEQSELYTKYLLISILLSFAVI